MHGIARVSALYKNTLTGEMLRNAL